jgi:5'-3' exonuclease
LYNYKSFLHDFGFEPELYSSYKSIVGDSSDNIPGVNSIGPKRGMEIIKRYGHLNDWLLSIQPNDKDIVSKNAFSCRLKYKNVRTFFKLIDLSENYSGLQLKLTSNVYK